MELLDPTDAAQPPREPDPWFASKLEPLEPVVPSSRFASWRGRMLAWLGARLSVSDCLVALGLALVGRGCYLLHPAAGYAVPGVVLLWYALPQRPRFMEPAGPKVVNITQPVEASWRQQQQGAPHGRA